MDLIEFCYGSDTNIYEMLDIEQDASQKEIQAAFMKCRLQLYQTIQSMEGDGDSGFTVKDQNGKEVKLSEKQFVEKKMDALVAAFRILRDPRKRRKYDASLGGNNSNNNIQQLRKSPKSLMDYPDSSREIEESLTEDLNDTHVSSNEDLDARSETATPVKQKKRIVKLKGSSNPPVRRSQSSSRDRKIKAKLGSDSSVVSESMMSKSDSSMNIKKIRSQKSKQSVVSIDTTEDDDSVVEFYQDVVVRQETYLGNWLRRNDFSTQGNAVDELTTEIVGSVADLWLSTKQVALAFSVEDEAIDALTGTINDAAMDLSSGKFAN